MSLIILLTVIFCVFSAEYDSDKIILDHKPRFVFRAIVIFILAWFDIERFLFLSSIFYLFFDYTYNYFRGNHIFYIGETAEIDKFKRKYFGRYLTILDIAHKFIILGILTILLYN